MVWENEKCNYTGMPKTRKLTGTGYWALICDCSKYGDKDLLICGVGGDKRSMIELNKEVKDCPAKHKILKVKRVHLEV